MEPFFLGSNNIPVDKKISLIGAEWPYLNAQIDFALLEGIKIFC